MFKNKRKYKGNISMFYKTKNSKSMDFPLPRPYAIFKKLTSHRKTTFIECENDLLTTHGKKQSRINSSKLKSGYHIYQSLICFLSHPFF